MSTPAGGSENQLAYCDAAACCRPWIGRLRHQPVANIVDRYEREYIGLNIQIQPGYDHFIQTSDPAIQAKLIAARRGDLVRVHGVVKGNGRNIRVLSFEVIKAAPVLELVPAARAEEPVPEGLAA